MPDDRAQDAQPADFSTPVWQNPGNDFNAPQSVDPDPIGVSDQPLPQEEFVSQFETQPQAQPVPQTQPEPQTQLPPDEQPSYEEQVQPEPEAEQPYYPQYAQMPMQPEPEYLLLEWIADSRVTWRRSKEYYSSLAVIVLLISLILFFAGQTLLIFVVLAFLFISYVLSTVRAESIPHQFTTYGLRYRGEKLIYWSEMVRFWAKNNHGITEIHIEAPGELMNELILLPANAQSPSPVNAQDIADLLSRYLPFEEPLPSQLDRWVTWIQEKFPLE